MLYGIISRFPMAQYTVASVSYRNSYLAFFAGEVFLIPVEEVLLAASPFMLLIAVCLPEFLNCLTNRIVPLLEERPILCQFIQDLFGRRVVSMYWLTICHASLV